MFWHRQQELLQLYRRFHDPVRNDSMVHPDEVTKWAKEQGIAIPEALFNSGERLRAADHGVQIWTSRALEIATELRPKYPSPRFNYDKLAAKVRDEMERRNA